MKRERCPRSLGRLLARKRARLPRKLQATGPRGRYTPVKLGQIDRSLTIIRRLMSTTIGLSPSRMKH